MHCDRPGSGGALGESTVKMHPRSAYHSECSRGSEQAGDHGEEPEDQGASGIQAQYRKDDHRPQQVLATARQALAI